MIFNKTARCIVMVLCSIVLAACGGSRVEPISSSSTDIAPESVQFVSADGEYSVSEQDLVDRATLIIVGVPVGVPIFTPTSDDLLIGEYVHDVHVVDIIDGTLGDTKVQVVRAGVPSDTSKDKIIRSDDLAGSLVQGKQILFLHPSARPNVFQVVGHVSGEMQLDAKGKTHNVRTEVKGFDNLDTDAIKSKVKVHKKAK